MDRIPISDSQAESVNILDKSAKPSQYTTVHNIIVFDDKGDQPVGKKGLLLGPGLRPYPWVMRFVHMIPELARRCQRGFEIIDR